MCWPRAHALGSEGQLLDRVVCRHHGLVEERWLILGNQLDDEIGRTADRCGQELTLLVAAILFGNRTQRQAQETIRIERQPLIRLPITEPQAVLSAHERTREQLRMIGGVGSQLCPAAAQTVGPILQPIIYCARVEIGLLKK
jgi:hypothetical protein